MIASFATAGFVRVPGVLTASACDAQAARPAEDHGAGDRSLLRRPRFASLVDTFRRHPVLSAILSDALVAMQCTRFEKTNARKWLVRVHLDPCTPEDGPLCVAPGSHRRGRLDAGTAARLHDDAGEMTCIAEIGDACVIRPLLLHASPKATGSSRRRVLHFLFGPVSLPLDLQWNRAV